MELRTGDTDGSPVVLRRQFEHVLNTSVFWFVLCLVVASAIWLPDLVPLADRAEYALLLSLVAWLVFLVSKARIMIGDDGHIEVVNWYVLWEIPVGTVDLISTKGELRIILRDGRILDFRGYAAA